MIIECTHCGAPLETPNARGIVTCAYCGTKAATKSFKTLAMQRPAGWTPPQEWLPPAGSAAGQSPLPYRGSPEMSMGPRFALIAVGSVAFMCLIMGAAVAALVYSAGKQQSAAVHSATAKSLAASKLRPDQLAKLQQAYAGLPGGKRGKSWAGDAPLRCEGIDRVRVSDKTIRLPGQRAIEVKGACQLELLNVTIEAAEGIVAEGAGTITIRNSRIQTTGATLSAGGVRQVQVHDSALISDAAIAVGSGSASFAFHDSRVQTSAAAFSMSGLASHSLNNTTVHEGDAH